MATTIKLKNGSGAPLAGDLVQGEPALDLTNKRLYTEDSLGTVIEVGTNPTSLTTGTFTSTGIDDNATSTAITIDSSENVGVGTTSPSKKLHVSGSGSAAQIMLESTSTVNGQLIFKNASTTNNFYVGLLGDTSGDALLYHGDAKNMTFWTSGAEKMRIDSSGNVGIGTTSPSSKLEVSGKTIVGSDSSNALEVFSSGDTEIAFSYSSKGNIYGKIIGDITTASPLGGDIAFQTATGGSLSERMRIDSSGSVGIGTSSPNTNAKFEVVSTSAGAVTNVIQLRNGDATAGSGAKLQFLNSTVNYATAGTSEITGVRYSGNYSALTFTTYGPTSLVERMRIDGVGNVGIGTASPSTILELSDAQNLRFDLGTSGTNEILSVGGADNLSLRSGGSANILFKNGSSEAMRINSSGNVGIGTSTPDETLHVHKGSAGSVSSNSFSVLTLENDTICVLQTLVPSGSSAQLRFGDAADNGKGILSYDHSTDHMQFNVNGPERMRINSDGAALIGATSASNTTGTGVKLFPEGYGGASSAVGIVGASSTGANSGFRMYSTGASAYRFYVDYAGTIFATSTSISAISDASLKENVRDLDKGLDTINALQPRRFDWKNGDGNDIMGFIAQEVEEVMPELVHEYKYSDEENKKGLKMGDMVPSMVKAIQELSAQVNELKAEVAALKGA